MPPAGHRPVSPQRAIRVVPRREGDEPTRRDVRPADVAGAPAVDGSVAVQCAGVVLPRIDRRERPCGRLELAEVVLTSTDDRAAGAQSARIRLTDAYRREAVVGRRRHRAGGHRHDRAGQPAVHLGGGGEEAPAGQLPVAPGTVSLALLEPELDPAALELAATIRNSMTAWSSVAVCWPEAANETAATAPAATTTVRAACTSRAGRDRRVVIAPACQASRPRTA